MSVDVKVKRTVVLFYGIMGKTRARDFVINVDDDLNIFIYDLSLQIRDKKVRSVFFYFL